MYKMNFRLGLVPKQFIELFTKIEGMHSYHKDNYQALNKLFLGLY